MIKRSKAWLLGVVLAVLITLNVTVLMKYADTANALQSTQAQVVETKKAHQTASKRLSETLEQKTTIDTSLREERVKTQDLEQENASLKVNLQAKKEREVKAAQEAKLVQVAKVSQPAAPVANISGNKESWLAASGIPADQWGYVDSIVTRESGWNPNAVNASSGACGLGQQLPCGKWSGAWNDPVAALRAQHGYVVDRYGSYAGAVAFWNANHWY